MKISEGHLLFALATSATTSSLKLSSFSSQLFFSKDNKKGHPTAMHVSSLEE